MAQVVKSSRLTLADKLSRLSFLQACDLLGGTEQGRKLLFAGGKTVIGNPQEQVLLADDQFRLTLPGETGVITVAVKLRGDNERRLQVSCTQCQSPCEHMGAALSLILENKTLLGLAKAPAKREPIEPLNEQQLTELALSERQQRAKKESMDVVAADKSATTPWTDYIVTSRVSGKSYRVALRGFERGDSYCTCPDYRDNTLGTCKHVMKALLTIRRRFDAAVLKRKPKLKEIIVYLKYGSDLTLRLGIPNRPGESVLRVTGSLRDEDITDVHALVRCLGRLEALGESVLVYPDAEEFIQQQLHVQRIQQLVADIRKNPRNHPLRTQLLRVELLPHQMDGIAFAVGAGRAILADDMGLGKTIQGVGVAELLAREAGIERVLVVCPTSLKSQWQNEIQRFSERSSAIVAGSAGDRVSQYQQPEFFTICNYEQVLKDINSIESARWDLIILDEGQRIKNWEAQTTRVVKSLKSRFALVLSGTPLENRLDELYSVVQFIDGRHLGPGFRFFNRYRVTDEKGFVLGYRHLDELREKLRPILLRRTRELVIRDLPPRNTEIIHVPPTEEQASLHGAHLRIVASITRKPYVSEMDLLRLRQALLMCRMSADSTVLVDKVSPGFSSKLPALDELFESLFVDGDHKAVVFSEWTRMLDLIEPLLKRRRVEFVRLEGKIPQARRQDIVNEFQNNPKCRVFLSTNAGSTGLNLQSADTVINVDLPWNPAVLEQRIARAHRMGQKRPVNVYILVTQETLEENLLSVIGQKKELATAALDYESEISEVRLQSGMDELKSRLEVLLGALPEGHQDESQKRARAAEAVQLAERREKMAEAGGQMLTAAFSLLSQMLPGAATAPAPEAVSTIRQHLTDSVETDEQGRRSLRITLPSDDAITQFAETLARLMVVGSPKHG